MPQLPTSLATNDLSEKRISEHTLPDIYEKRPELKNKLENQGNLFNSKDVTQINQLAIQNTLESDEAGDENKYLFSTFKDYDNVELTNDMTNSSLNAFLHARKNPFVSQKTSAFGPPASTYNDCKLDFNPPNTNTDFVLTTSNQYSLQPKRPIPAFNDTNKHAILPNLNAVRRHNIPLKGT